MKFNKPFHPKLSDSLSADVFAQLQSLKTSLSNKTCARTSKQGRGKSRNSQGGAETLVAEQKVDRKPEAQRERYIPLVLNTPIPSLLKVASRSRRTNFTLAKPQQTKRMSRVDKAISLSKGSVTESKEPSFYGEGLHGGAQS